jgi:transcription elongation factor GreB
MSKAFTKEPDGEDDDSDLVPAVDVPGGFKNYITPEGYKRLNDELAHLWKVDRPKLVETIAWAASNGDRSENGDYIYGKRKLREIDRRIRFLNQRIDSAVVVDNAGKEHERVYFGATVTVADENGDERTVSIVGVDEIDPRGGRVSWISPMATALLKASVGDVVTLRTPRGPEELEILAIRYDDLSRTPDRRP